MQCCHCIGYIMHVSEDEVWTVDMAETVLWVCGSRDLCTYVALLYCMCLHASIRIALPVIGALILLAIVFIIIVICWRRNRCALCRYVALLQLYCVLMSISFCLSVCLSVCLSICIT